MTAVVAETRAIDRGELKGSSQWDMFQNDMHAIAEKLTSQKSYAHYSPVMEFLFPPGNRSVFGIHYYVLGQQGKNA